MTQVSADYLFIENAFCKVYLLCHMSLQCPTENVIMKMKYMFFSIASVYVWTSQLRIYTGSWSQELYCRFIEIIHALLNTVVALQQALLMLIHN